MKPSFKFYFDVLNMKAGDACEVTYSGTLKDGRKFDAGTTSFAPNQVIKVNHLSSQLHSPDLH